jgi:hypothetical protein
MTKEELGKLKRTEDLREFALEYFGIESNKSGMAHCPFHPEDKNPSFQFWQGKDGIYRYTDHHTKQKGTIVDFMMAIGGIKVGEACKRLDKIFFGDRPKESAKAGQPFVYVYRDPAGKPVFRKMKIVNANGEKKYWLERYQDGKWLPKRGGREPIPYNLNERSNKTKAIVCEGEKDADTVNSITRTEGPEYWVTSAMYGKASWSDCLTKYFDGFSEVTFIYDVGAKEQARKHGIALKSAFPELLVMIASVPLDTYEADITDYLSGIGADKAIETKALALLEILEKSKGLDEIPEAGEAIKEMTSASESSYA